MPSDIPVPPPAPSCLLVPPYPAEQAAAPAVVAVTGATGYVAACIVERLLALGHTVHGTCRDHAKAQALKALPGGQQRLKLFNADLSTPNSFDEAFVGCDYVIHCASPYINGVPKGQVMERLVKPAVQGTENVLASVNKVPSVKRVVLTSSCAAVFGSPIERGEGHVFTEEDWCITPTQSVLPYFYSKREAEKKAWEMAGKQSRWDLVVINPPGVFGPPATARADGESINIMRQIVKGVMYPACPDLGISSVDVRDVAAAHTLAMLNPAAKGRYICCGQNGDMKGLVTEVAKLYPGKVCAPIMAPPKFLLYLLGPLVGLPRDFVTHAIGLKGPIMSSDKIKSELGFKFLPIQVTLKDMAEKMSEVGLLPKLS